MNPQQGGTPSLTEQQARSLAVEGASVALGAGAGCGKTMVLTARFLGDLEGEDRRSLRSVVALTFTKKAARELRQRIRRRCRERLATGADDAHWRSVLRGLEAAPIGTFHEFCGQWLRRHAVAARIDPDFTIFDDSIAGTIRDEALGRSLRLWLASCDPDLIELAVEFGLAQVRQALADLLAHRAIGEIDRWAELSVDEIIAVWQSAWDAKGREARLHKLGLAARRCVDFLRLHESTHPKMSERRAYLLESLGALGPADLSDSVLSAIREQARVQGGGKAENWPSAEAYERVKRHFEELRKEVDSFLKSSQWDEAASRLAAEHGRRLARLAVQLRQAYTEAKRVRGGLDFDDLIVMTRNLLRTQVDETGDGGTPKAEISRLLVDEFQDTDEMQGEILRSLGGGTYREGRLFLVGDFKQSIYRFRGADPRIFDEFRNEFPSQGHLALTENFRSVPAVLDFVNALFAESFGERENRLVPGAKASQGDAQDQPAVEFLWASETETEPVGPKKPRVRVRDLRKVEARWIARRLRQRLELGWMIRDRKTGERRRAHAGDVALLFRAMTDAAPYESSLADEGFDYHVVGGSAFYAQQEVHDLINVLSVVEDPLDSVSLAGALRSPFFCVSDDGLYWLATSRFGDLPGGLDHTEDIAELSTLDRRHTDRARALLGRWRSLKDRVPIATLVDRVLDESGYEAALLGEFLGARKRANARKLVRLARQFDQQGGFTVANFVARLREDLRTTPREEQAATTDEEGTSIRLMSIHQAKGLEFPIVVLPDLNRKPAGGRDFVAYDPNLGPLIRLAPGALAGKAATGASYGAEEEDVEAGGQGLGWLTYRALEQRDEFDESMRLFYVATTRARDALILSAGLGPNDKTASPAMALLSERFDRASGACRAWLPDGWSIPTVHVTTECPPPLPSHADPVGRPGFPSLIEVAEAIETTTVRPATRPESIPTRRPHFVDLDPSPRLPPRLARLDRLTRAILADPRAVGPDRIELARVGVQVGRRQQPAAHAGLIAEALESLRPWVEGAFGRMISEATAIERALSWTIAWPPGMLDRTVLQGTLDFLYRDLEGDWGAVVVGRSESSLAQERLRLLLGIRAADALGFGPVRRGWHLRLGVDAGLRGEDGCETATIDEAIRAAIEAKFIEVG